MTGRLNRSYLARPRGFAHFLCGPAGIHQAADNSVFDQLYTLAPDALSIEGSACLERMVNIVGDLDVVSEDLLADAIVQKRALVEHRLATPIPKHKANEVEHGSRLENHSVLTWRQLSRSSRLERLFRGALRQLRGIEVSHVGRIGLLPTRGIFSQHRD